MLEEEIKSADLKKGDVVLEIGAGFGSLTIKIVKHCNVLAVEKDTCFLKYLWRIPNCVAMGNDILKILEEGREAGKNPFNKIIGNIPYSISQDIVLEIMKHTWEIAVLCVQKEFAEKMNGDDKLGFLIKDCCEIKIAKQVKADRFYPEAVDSTIVILKQKKKMDENLWKFLQKIFRARNKNLGNVIKNCPQKYKAKKAMQLTSTEIKDLYTKTK